MHIRCFIAIEMPVQYCWRFLRSYSVAQKHPTMREPEINYTCLVAWYVFAQAQGGIDVGNTMFVSNRQIGNPNASSGKVRQPNSMRT